jgi:hypothetical protein
MLAKSSRKLSGVLLEAWVISRLWIKVNSIAVCELLLGRGKLRQLLNASFSAYVYISAYNRLSRSEVRLHCRNYLSSRNFFVKYLVYLWHC